MAEAGETLEIGADAVIGVISDTHGLLRPAAAAAMAGSDLILHIGDVGRPEILDALREIAPVVAVRGNVDYGDWADALPMTETIAFGGHLIYMIHILAELPLDPKAAGFAAVLYGHSHKPDMSEKNGVIYYNPGSAGPRRFSLPITAGRLHIQKGRLRPELIQLEGG
jgi:putative phosphoesterase